MENTEFAEKFGDLPEELQAKIRGWISEHDEVVVFRTKRGTCVFRTPDQDSYERFVDRVSVDKNSKAIALRELSYSAVLYPSLDELRIIFQKKPGLTNGIGARLVEMAGGSETGDVAKA